MLLELLGGQEHGALAQIAVAPRAHGKGELEGRLMSADLTGFGVLELRAYTSVSNALRATMLPCTRSSFSKKSAHVAACCAAPCTAVTSSCAT